MANVTISLTSISDADTTTGWSGSSGQLDEQVFKQQTTEGTGGSYTYQTGKNILAVCTFTPTSPLNMTLISSIVNVYWSMRCDVFPFCELLNTGATNSGLMLRLTDGTGNFTQWHIAGRDTWDGGWKTFVLDISNTTNIHSSSGTLNLANVSIFSWYTDNSNSGNIRIIDNTWLDAIAYGYKAIIESITTEDVNFQDIADKDVSLISYAGLLRYYNGILFSQGSLYIGDDGQVTNFVSENETIYFKDVIINPSSVSIEANQGSIIYDHSNTFVNIDGLVCNSSVTYPANFKFYNDESFLTPNLKEFHLNNSTFYGLNDISIGYNPVNVPSTFTSNSFNNCIGSILLSFLTADNCSWIGCSPVVTGDGSLQPDITNCTISEHINQGLITKDLNTITDCLFISPSTLRHAVEFQATGDNSMNWNNYLEGYASVDGNTGGEAIYVPATSGILTINVGAGYNIPSIRTGGATVNVVSGQVTTTITVRNQDGDVVVGARVYLVSESTIEYPTPPLTDGTLIFNELTDVNGQVIDIRSLASNQPVKGWSRDSTSPPPIYKQTRITEIIDNGIGLNLNMLLILDE